MRRRVEFTLSMQSCGSWDGKWSGAGKHYAIVRDLAADACAKLLGDGSKAYWTHRWEDGWAAGISARVVPHGEHLKKSAGFCGYDWMVNNILDHGSPYNKDHTQ